MTILSPPTKRGPAEMLDLQVSALGAAFADLRGITSRFKASHIVLLGSIFLICMGTAALCGWLFQWRFFLQLLPGAPFIAFESALGFLLAGLALLAASTEALGLSRWLGAFLLVYGAVFVTAILQGIYFSLHAFFPILTAAVIYPLPIREVKMAEGIAVVFVLLGIFFILLGRPRPSRSSLNVAMFLASAVLSLGLLGLLTFVTGLADQHTWISYLARMALPTALLVCVAGVSMGALCWARTDETGRRFQNAAASFTLIGLILLFVAASFLAVANADIQVESRRNQITNSRQISLVQSIVNSVRRAETGQRGFLLTGAEAYLRDYEAGLHSESADLQAFRSYPYGDHQADALRSPICQKLAELARTVSLGRNDEREKALAIVKSGQGLQLMSQIDAESAKLIGAMDAERTRRREWLDEALRITQKTVVFSCVIGFVMLGLGLGVLRAEISRRARVESELRKRTTQLEAAVKELDEFAYAASHDLKAPLRAIHNSAKWLEEDLAEHLTGETRDHLTVLQGRTTRMEKLLDDLLAYARIGRKTDIRYAETISGTLLMEDVLALVPLQGFTVEVSPAFRNIQVSRMPLQQILMNLIGNAIKHHHQKTGNIAVTASEDGDSYAFAVKDDGPGIGAQFHTRIFEMFRTLKPRDQVEGSGIGLAMVRKHIEVSGGTLQLESAEGQGSTFRFTLFKREEQRKEVDRIDPQTWPGAA